MSSDIMQQDKKNKSRSGQKRSPGGLQNLVETLITKVTEGVKCNLSDPERINEALPSVRKAG